MDMKTIDTLSKTERSILLYAETCCVDYGGLLEGERMNADDIAALRKFEGAGLLTFGRVPYRLIGLISSHGRKPTHWVTFTDEAWQIAHSLRRRRASQPSASRQKVDAELAECAA